MATRMIPPAPGTFGRTRKTSVRRELVDVNYGFVRQYGACPLTVPANQMIPTGGSAMTAILGPDLGDGQRRGTPTNANSLQPLMGLLHANSAKTWKAGHLLNAELGGSGTQNQNLTPLTAAANNAHRVFEGHLKRMLTLCYNIDKTYPNLNEWYGVEYTVAVSAVPYANLVAPADMHSYVYSDLTLDYQFVHIPKFPAFVAPHLMPAPPNICVPVVLGDPHAADIQNVVMPNFAPSVNIANWQHTPARMVFSVEIHNEP